MASAILVAALSVALVEAPVLAAPATSPAVPLGVVLQAENARAGLDLASSGETIYDGDRLQTPADGTLRARLAAGQLFLRQDTVAEVHAIAGGFSAELEHGSVVASSTGGQSFRVIADGATIRPASAQPTTAQVTKMSPTELVLTSTRGTLEISMGEDVKTIEPGSSYRLVVEPDTAQNQPPPEGVGAGKEKPQQQQQQQPQQPQQPQQQQQSQKQQLPLPTARNRFLLILIPAIIVTTGIIAWRVSISPDAPK